MQPTNLSNTTGLLAYSYISSADELPLFCFYGYRQNGGILSAFSFDGNLLVGAVRTCEPGELQGIEEIEWIVGIESSGGAV